MPPKKQPDYSGIVVEIKKGPIRNEKKIREPETGLLFCKELGKFFAFDARDEHWGLGKVIHFDTREDRNGFIHLTNTFKKTLQYESTEGDMLIEPIVKVKVQQRTQYFPYKLVGFNEVFGDVLIPKCEMNGIQDGDVLYVKVQFCDFFIDGIFWVATSFSLDNKSEYVTLGDEDRNLTFSSQSYFQHYEKQKAKKTEKQRVGRDRNFETPTNYTPSPLNAVKNKESEKRKPIVPECVLYFDPLDEGKIKAVPFTQRGNLNYYKFAVIIKLEDNYAIGFLQADPERLVCVFDSFSEKYDELIKEGAVLEIEVNRIIKEQSHNTPFDFNVTYIADFGNIIARSIPVENGFIFEAVLDSASLKLDSFDDVLNIEQNSEDKMIDSNYGKILFKSRVFKELHKYLDDYFDEKIEGFKFTCQFMRNHSTGCSFISSKNIQPGLLQTNTKEKEEPQNEEEEGDNFGMDF